MPSLLSKGVSPNRVLRSIPFPNVHVRLFRLAVDLSERDPAEHRVLGQVAGCLSVSNRVSACASSALRLRGKGGLQAEREQAQHQRRGAGRRGREA